MAETVVSVAGWQATMVMSGKSNHVKVCKIRDQSPVTSNLEALTKSKVDSWSDLGGR
jgi:hypothetical protein